MRAFFAVALVALAIGASAQTLKQEERYAPIPYQFAYKAESGEGSHSQQETSDGNGRVEGSYSLNLADGRQRTVTYWADETGFHADVNTNELGTESKDAADAKYSSSAITGEQAAVQYGAVAPAVEKVKVYQAPAPTVKTEVYHAPAPVVKTYQTTPVIKTYQTTPVIKTYATAPVVKAYGTSPVIRTYAHAQPVTVLKTAVAPTVVKTVQTAPVQYAYAHATPVGYTAQAPVAYSVAGDYHHVDGDYHHVDGDYHHVVGKA